MRRMKQVKRIVAAVLSLAIVLTGIYWSEKPADEVQAASEAQASASTEANTDMLSVKVQRRCIGGEWQNAMRFVASVDSLNYKNVGFAITTEGGTEKEYILNTKQYPLPQRIVSADVGMEYTFSPKVVDTSSTYFVTAKWRAEEDVEYTVRAWVENFDGTKIYGQSRCVTLEDLVATNYLNMSFDAGENHGIQDGDELTVTYGDNNTTATVISTKDNTVHVNVNVTVENLPSATKFVFAKDGAEVGSNIYRYLYTEYSETETTNTADTSWYDVYSTEDSSEDEFVIATNADMYGFMHLMNGTNGKTREVFGNKTVYLVSDIAMNDVTEGVTAAEWAEADAAGTTLETTPYQWVTACDAIDTTTHFAGTFDGQMHKISGVYVKQDKQYAALFGIIASTSVVGNFYLKESYFTSTYNKDATGNTELYIGSVAGQCRGTVRNVYSDAILQSTHSTGRRLGGITAFLNTTDTEHPSTVDNCWFDGEVRLNYQQAGGIVGYVQRNTNYITNCLFTGIVTNATTGSACSRVGGIVGINNASSTTYIEDCIGAGTINASQHEGFVVGNAVAGSNYSLMNAYGVGSSCTSTHGNINADATMENKGILYAVTDMQGSSAYRNTLLDFEDVWCARKGEIPALKIFRNEIGEEANLTGYAQDNWYDAAVNKYRIHSLSAFQTFRNLVNDGKTFADMKVYLNTDIDLNPGWTVTIDDETELLSGDAPENVWVPIGNDTNQFKGTFSGEGHTVSGLYMNENATYMGLFGYLGAGSISDLQIVNSYIQGGEGALAGSAVGLLLEGTVSNIYSDAFIVNNSATTDNKKMTAMGGIVGETYHNGNPKNIEQCWFAGAVLQPITSVTLKHRFGGILGRNIERTATVTVSNCLNTGIVKNSMTSEQYPNTGGIVGGTGPAQDGYSHLNINNCVNLGEISTGSSYRGGQGMAPIIAEVLGYADVTITDSVWLNVEDLDSKRVGNYAKLDDRAYGYQQYKEGGTSTITLTQSVQCQDIATLCNARMTSADTLKAVGFVGLTEDDTTPKFSYMSVKGITTGMSNVAQSDETAKGCIILSDFEDWWLEYYNLEKDVFNLLMVGDDCDFNYEDELYGMAASAGISLAVYHISKDELDDYLKYAEWDAISLQASGYQTITDYAILEAQNLKNATELYQYIHEKQPNAQLLWQEAWQCEVGCEHVATREDQIARHEIHQDLAQAICEANQELGVTIVPTGDAWERIREDYYKSESYTSLCAATSGGDSCHDGDIGGGQYLNARVWIEVLTGKMYVGSQYLPTYELTNYDTRTLQEYAHQAVFADFVATDTDEDSINEFYGGRTAYFGDAHTHPWSGNEHIEGDSRDDGNVLFDTWIEQMEALNLDFIAAVNHRQVTSHMTKYVDEHPDIFIGGTEPLAHITDYAGYATDAIHYNMILPSSDALIEVLNEFGYGYNAETDKYNYVNFSKTEMEQVIKAVQERGGLFVHPHPKATLTSDKSIDYWFADDTGLEVFYSDADGTIAGEDTIDNYNLWTDLLAQGKRIWATSGSDSHDNAEDTALTCIYSEKQYNTNFVSYLAEGDFVCGGVGISMVVGGAKMGSHTDFAGKRVAISVDEFHSSITKKEYIINVLSDKGVVYTTTTDCSKPVNIAFDADENAKFYRVEVIDPDILTQPIIAIGNPIWNDK